MKQPPITVLMPVYNTEKYLKESIESVLNQTFRDFEFLIIDDGSTDNSVKIIESYNDKRIRLVRNEKNMKLIATLNKGLGMVNGKYICRFDSDDICYPTRLEKQFLFMESNPEYAACASWLVNFYEDTNNLHLGKYNEFTDEIRIKTLYQNHFVHPASFIRKSFIEARNLRFDPSFIHSEDYYFFVKLSEISKLYNIQEPLVKVRKHEFNVSKLNSDIQNKNSINVIKYQLSKIGIEPSNIDYDLYFRFFYAAFDFSKQEIEEIEALMIKIINANEKSRYLPQDKLYYFITEKWIHLCLNSANIKETDELFFYISQKNV